MELDTLYNNTNQSNPLWNVSHLMFWSGFVRFRVVIQ